MRSLIALASSEYLEPTEVGCFEGRKLSNQPLKLRRLTETMGRTTPPPLGTSSCLTLLPTSLQGALRITHHPLGEISLPQTLTVQVSAPYIK